MHGALSGNSTIDVGHNGSYYRLYSTINDNIAAITVENHNHPFNVCADVYAVPIGQDCAEGSFPPNLSLGDFQVETDRTFTWTLSDTINPVPEPGTWTLLFGGFGAIGSALRRRRAARGATG
jgi:hypothetical protein